MMTDRRARVQETAGEVGERSHKAGLQGKTGAHGAAVQP